MIGISQYYLGNCSVRGAISSACSPTAPRRPGSRQIPRFEGDEWNRLRAYLARILWLRGYPDEAMRTRGKQHRRSPGDQSYHLDG